MVKLFEYSGYKGYLKALEKELKPLQKGFRSRLAETLGCQNAYISQILNTHAHFSLEQALKIARYLKLDELETRYFILLIEVERAGTPDLKKYFKQDLDQLRAQYLNIKAHVKESHTLSIEDQSRYYSSALYAAIHILVTIPQFRTLEKMAEALTLPMSAVHEIVAFLLSSGLLSQKNESFFPGPTQIHLSKDSPLIRQHHCNWRINAIHSLATTIDKDIHYSTVSSLSRADAEKLKTRLVKVIEEYVETVKPSQEEVLYNFNLDFYSLLKTERSETLYDGRSI